MSDFPNFVPAEMFVDQSLPADSSGLMPGDPVAMQGITSTVIRVENELALLEFEDETRSWHKVSDVRRKFPDSCRSCRHCIYEAIDPQDFTRLMMVGMILCATCGNKRCPHANDHRNACTGSNEPGQEGSAYP